MLAIFFQQVFDHREAVQAGHLDIEKYDIRVVGADEVDGLDTVLALGDHIHPARRVEQVSQLLARELFIIDDDGCHGHQIVIPPARRNRMRQCCRGRHEAGRACCLWTVRARSARNRDR